MPKPHQSMSFPQPSPTITSGALCFIIVCYCKRDFKCFVPTYSGVPTKVASSFACSFIVGPNLAIPKSVRQIYPFSSIKIFSGFKSR